MTTSVDLANAIHAARHHAGGADALTPADIGAEAVGVAADIVGGQHLSDLDTFAHIDDVRLSDQRTPLDDSVTTPKLALSYPTFAGLPSPVVAGDVAYQADQDRFLIVGKNGEWRWSETPVNLLTPNQASVETDLTGIVGGGNCTIARTTSTSLSGSASLAVTLTADTSTAWPQTSPTYASVMAGRTYTAVVSAKGDAGVVNSAAVQIVWRTSAGALINTPTATAQPLSPAWSTFRLTAVAPANAAFAYLAFVINCGTGSTGKVLYMDQLGIWEGAGGVWVPGGERLDPSFLGKYWDETVGRREFAWDYNNNRWQMVYGDTGWRDVTSLVGSEWKTAGASTVSMVLRRIGYTVYVEFSVALVDPNTKPTGNLAVLGAPYAGPVGGQIDYSDMFALYDTSGIATPVWIREQAGTLFPLGGGRFPATPASGVFRGRLSWSTTDLWPTVLPGTMLNGVPVPSA